MVTYRFTEEGLHFKLENSDRWVLCRNFVYNHAFQTDSGGKGLMRVVIEKQSEGFLLSAYGTTAELHMVGQEACLTWEGFNKAIRGE